MEGKEKRMKKFEREEWKRFMRNSNFKVLLNVKTLLDNYVDCTE